MPKINRKREKHMDAPYDEADVHKQIFSKSDMSNILRVNITVPKNKDEICSITLDPIHENPTMHEFKITNTPIQSKPRHSCIELQCSHRFNGMALLVHFAKNSMTCPMCRAGIQDKMNFWASFPHEPWLEIMQNIIASDQPVSNHMPENMIFANVSRRFPSSFVLREFTRDLESLEDGPVIRNDAYQIAQDFVVTAIFYMYRTHTTENQQNEAPALSLQCTLSVNDTRRGYTISSTFARIISEAINDLDLKSISATIYARNLMHNSTVGIATMNRTELSREQNEIVAEVSPPIYSITIRLDHGPRMIEFDNNQATFLSFLDFLFVPGENTYSLFSTSYYSN